MTELLVIVFVASLVADIVYEHLRLWALAFVTIRRNARRAMRDEP